MNKIHDLTEMRFGSLTVTKRGEDRHRRDNGSPIVMWVCRCDCGIETVVNGCNLVSGHTTSCGCKAIKHGKARKERLYNIWVGMRQRCRDTKSIPSNLPRLQKTL